MVMVTDRTPKGMFIRRDKLALAEQQIGNIYSHLLIVGVYPKRDKYCNILYQVKCLRCNSETVTLVRLAFLRSGQQKSCGCLKEDLARERMVAIHKQQRQQRAANVSSENQSC